MAFDPKIGLTDKPCHYCGSMMFQVGVRRQYCDSCQGHQSWKILKHRYGITLEQYKDLLAKQSHVCAICEQPETRKAYGKLSFLSVDHCHNTGKVRGLLCNRCNVFIGRAEDNPELLRKAVNYLETSMGGVLARGSQNNFTQGRLF